MGLRSLCLVGILSALLVAASSACAADSPAGEDRWVLINTDANGNQTHIDADSLERLDGSVVRVMMKFTNARAGSEMYFVDELDCGRGLIKRLSINLKSPPCTGGIDYDASFDAKWDSISTGLEEKLRDAVCTGNGKRAETTNDSE